MKVTFACPSCAAPGTADAFLVGREVLCRHCKARFLIPAPGEGEPDVYALDDSSGASAGASPDPPEPPSTVVHAVGGGETAYVPQRRPRRAAVVREARDRSESQSSIPWAAVLACAGIALAVALATVALVVPGGVTKVAAVLMGIGSLMVLVGYAAGAYGAFREDFLYGFLYLVIPLYTAYYVATRWEDLWRWFACSTAGVAFVLVGTELMRWDGALP